ncbi:MAG: hypothetical protein H0U22_12895 [Geodermatophilaceae bacterium]|nr:hypothetical protein [Geodermatophilaceae bacterium]
MTDGTLMRPGAPMQQGLYYTAAFVSMASAWGFTTIGAAADLDRLVQLTTDMYAVDHLRASLLTGTTGFAFTAVVTAAGAYLATTGNSGQRRAGRFILLLACLPSVVSVAELLILTPGDAWHTIPLLLSPSLILTGLLLRRRHARNRHGQRPASIRRSSSATSS